MYKNVFMLSRQELIQLTPTDVGDSTLKSLELQRILSAYGDFFSYDYANSHNHKKTIPPHAVLPNARHADVYVTGSIFKSALLLGIFAQQLAKRLSLGKEILELTPRQKREHKPPWIVGNQTSFFVVVALARELEAYQAVTRVLAGKDQEWTLPPLSNCAHVQLVSNFFFSCEDIFALKNAVLKPLTTSAQVLIQPEVGVAINLLGNSRVNGFKIVSALELEQHMWYQSDCPLCQEGSKALSVKDHWQELADSCWWEPPDEKPAKI